MKRIALLVFVALLANAAERRARNVILFIGDAAGIPTLNAASIYHYNEPQKLFLQHMPHLGLMDTSAANSWVTDSAAGMSAIVTGQKTNNSVLSETAAATREKDGEFLETILEYAEQHGLSTGVVSNMPMWDATPAACYSHVNLRSKAGEIFAQVLKPRYGDGVDLVLGAGRKRIFDDTAKLGIDLAPALREKGYTVYDSPEAVPADARRAIGLTDSKFDLAAVARRAIDILSRNPKGYFLMVECDAHTNNVRAGLDHVILLDGMIRETAARVKKDTLILFAADHSFDLRVQRGRRGAPLLPPEGAPETEKPNIRVDNSHTGEEVLVGAQGPGSERVHGFFPNTQLFHVMMAAYGWERSRAAGAATAGK